ncbi:hypothetical protein ACWC09_27625 [Streptomyces sp. NPDC001617]
MTGATFEGHYSWHPAADDRRLAQACTDVRAGRYFSAQEILKEARWDFDLRAHRSLVLASEAADSDLAERWLAEEVSAESTLMWARVAVLRVTRMAGTDDRRVAPLARIALAACKHAAEVFPEDPTPLVAQLAMARLLQYRDPAPNGMMLTHPGPWSLFSRILRLAPWHREAHHRMLAYFFIRNGGSKSATWDVAFFLSQRAPNWSALRLLPFVALVEDHNPQMLLAERVWEESAWKVIASAIYHNWFPEASDYRFIPVLDLSYLAHALFMTKLEFEARAVFTAMGPYAARMPWSAFGQPEQQLNKARRSCRLATTENI